MDTIGTHISVLRALLKEYDDSHGPFDDQMLYQMLKSGRATVISRRARKFNKLSDFNWQGYCIKLVKGKEHDCECVKRGCEVLVTKYKIPEPINGRNKELIKLRNMLNGNRIDLLPYDGYNKYNDILESKPYASLINSKVVLFNNSKETKAIRVFGIWKDPAEWEGIKLCDEDGNESSNYCYDVKSDAFPLDPDLHTPMYQEAFKMLQIPLKLTEDMINDANAEIRA